MYTNKFLEKHFQILYWGGLLLGFILSFLYAGNQILTGDQTQMLDKAYLGAFQGTWLGYGNAASVVGNVPGSLSGLIVGLPLLIWNHPFAPMIFLIMLHLASFFLLDSVIKEVYNQPIRILFLVLYWLNPWFLFENIIYNPSYLFVFSALHFWTSFRMSKKKSFLYSFLHILSIGMALQLHYSWIILPIISVYLYYRKMIHVHWAGIFSAGLIIIASLIPYFSSIMSHPELTSNAGEKVSDRYIGWGAVHVYPILKSFLYWLRYASFIFTNKLIMGANFDWISSTPWIQMAFTYIWRGALFAIGLGSLWFAFIANKYAWHSVKGKLLRNSTSELTTSAESWLLFYLVGTIIAIVISSGASPIVFNYWHLIIIFPFALIPLLMKVNHLVHYKNLQLTKYIFILTVYFTGINIIASHDSEKYSYKVSYTAQTLEQVATKYIK